MVMELDWGTEIGPERIDEKVIEQIINSRVEVDTSAPFESVMEAVSRFGELGYWKPSLHKLPDANEDEVVEIDIEKLEKQAAEVEKDLLVKERETLDVLKDLESTKAVMEELKMKLQKETSEVGSISVVKNKENDQGLSTCPDPSLILVELEQAKVNLSRTTNDLADIRASVDFLNKKLEKERLSLENTRERLLLNSSKVHVAKEAEIKGSSDNHVEISKELQRLTSEAEQFKKMGEAVRSEVSRAISEIEETKNKIKTAEMRLVAARKMKEAARAAEAVALAEIMTLSANEKTSGFPSEGVTLSFEEYSSLTSKAQEAEELSKKKVVDAMHQVDEANASKMDFLKKVEEAAEEVVTTKKALEEALNRVEAANQGKLAVEEALRNWRYEHGQKRRAVQNSTKFKNPCPSHRGKDPRMLDYNEENPVISGPTLSIGQILSRKLMLPEEFETEKGAIMKRKVSLGQMLRKQNGDPYSFQKAENVHKQLSGKRKKSGFAKFSLLLTKESKKKKKPTLDLK